MKGITACLSTIVLMACYGAPPSDYKDSGLDTDSEDSEYLYDPDPDDFDEDGFDYDEDCNDYDNTIHPGAREICYDGLDQDCLGDSDYDCDKDTFDSIEYGGTDCDDANPSVYTGAKDPEGDDIDQDCDTCDGVCAEPPALAYGDLVINEIMANPSTEEPETEWFELLVLYPEPTDLRGLVISNADGSRTVTIVDSLRVVPGARVLFGGEKVPFADVSLGSIQLGNSSGGLRVEKDKMVIDTVTWGEKGQPEIAINASIILDPAWATADSNDSDLYWCASPTPWEKKGDPGSPGEENPSCGVDGDADASLTPHDCDDHDATIHPGADDCTIDSIDQDCNGTDGPIDEDADGYDSCADCNDKDATINPGAKEICYTGVDQDCDGFPVYDCDEDGYDSIDYGGSDCDDTDAGIHPGAKDPSDDDIDQDCDGCEGVATTVYELSEGDLVISEILGNPSLSEPSNEWFEITIQREGCLNLQGLTFQNATGSDAETVSDPFIANYGDYLVFSRTKTEWVDYIYTRMTFSNSSADELLLTNGTTVIDRVDFNDVDEHDMPNSRSMILDPEHLSTAPDSDPTYWCDSEIVTLATDPSSPGQENESCGFGSTD